MAKVLMHTCYLVDREAGPPVGCGCERSQQNWLTKEEAIDYLRFGCAQFVSPKSESIVLKGRLPRYLWPRMVTSQVILGNVGAGHDPERNRWDRIFLREFRRLGWGPHPIRFDPKTHRAAFEGRAMITSWLDQRSKGLQK